jgi:cation-transporting ATPase 13A1
MILAFEATTALQRQHNMRTLRGMNTSGQTVLAFREGWWGALGTEALLPGDVISMRAGEGGGGSGGMGGGGGVAAGGAGAGGGAWGVPVPADLLLLRGRAVANEACLTGESVPQVSELLRSRQTIVLFLACTVVAPIRSIPQDTSLSIWAYHVTTLPSPLLPTQVLP